MKQLAFGADYYPEQWPRGMWARDADTMFSAGFRIVRLMEFGWGLVEPEPDNYDFSLFDEATTLFLSRGISVILGTPTAALPAWLGTQDGVLQEHPQAGQRNFGSRRQACLNSPLFLDRAERLTRALAKHYSQDFWSGSGRNHHKKEGNGQVLGWQVDNELGHEGSDLCVCPHCKAAWGRWLQARYGEISRVNDEWGTVFWSTQYSSWEQVPVPGPRVFSGQNPSLMLDWYRFMSDSASSFAAAQAAILRQAQPDWQITTNTFMPPNGHVLNLRELFAAMDYVGINNYPVWGDQAQPVPMQYHSTALRLIRDAKPGQPFTVFEQICGFQGHSFLGYLPPPEQIVFWTNHIAALGANNILYFRWRTAASGQEQLCHGLLDPWSPDTPHFRALRGEIQARRSFYKRLVGSKPCVRAALVYKKDDARLLKEQPLSSGFPYPGGFIDVGYDAELANSAAPLLLFGLDYLVLEQAEILADPGVLDGLDYLILAVPQLSDPELVQSIDSWVAQGGHLVLGWRAGTRSKNNKALNFPAPGPWSAAAGVSVPTSQSLGKGSRRLVLKTGLLGAVLGGLGRLAPALRAEAQVWEDHLLPASASTQVLARYRGPGGGSIVGNGQAAVCFHRHGAGSVLSLGTRLSPTALLAVFGKFFRETNKRMRQRARMQAAGETAPTAPASSSPGRGFCTSRRLPSARFLGDGLELITRVDEKGQLFGVLLNHTKKKKRSHLGSVPAWGVKIIEIASVEDGI